MCVLIEGYRLSGAKSGHVLAPNSPKVRCIADVRIYGGLYGAWLIDLAILWISKPNQCHTSLLEALVGQNAFKLTDLENRSHHPTTVTPMAWRCTGSDRGKRHKIQSQVAL